MSDRIFLFKPHFGKEESEALTETLQSGWWGRGPKTIEFEEAFADYLGVDHAVALNSATAALHLALLVAEVAGQEVLTTSMTFVSTNHAILHAGGRPVFCDIEPDTMNISAEEIRRKVTPTTRAVVVMHYGGHPCDMDAILDVAREHGLWVIEDASQACGAEYKGRKAGSMGYIGCFSFQATKNMSTGDGGMLVTGDGEVAERVRKLRWVGISKPTWERFRAGEPERSWMYEVEELGFKYEMTDLSATLGLVQLARLEESNNERRRLLERYKTAFSETDGIDVLNCRAYAKSASYNAVIKVEARDELYAHLNRHEIDSNVHSYPNHLLPIYRPYTTHLPVTEAEWLRILSIPLYPGLSTANQDRVIDCVRSFVATAAAAEQQL